MADILKYVSLQHSNSDNGGSSMKLGVQAVGFLSVLAISGSLAYLTRAKSVKQQQLWPQTHLSLLFNDDRSSNSNSVINPLPMQNLKQKMTMMMKKKKKVRFAPDVVDPAGDGKEYRRRHHEIPQLQQQQHESRIKQEQEQSWNDERSHKSCCTNIPANRLELYKGLRRSRLDRASLRL